MYCWAILFEADVKSGALSEHDVVVFASRHKAFHLGLQCENERFCTSSKLSKPRRLWTSIKQSAEDRVLCIPNQDQACIVAVSVLLRGVVQLLQTVAILGGLENQLGDANTHVGRYHHPQVRICLVVNQAGSQRSIRQVVDHLRNLVLADRLRHHGRHLLLTESVASGRSKRVSESVLQVDVMGAWHDTLALLSQFGHQLTLVRDCLDKGLVVLGYGISQTVEALDAFR